MISGQLDTTYKLTDFRIPDAGALKLEVNANLGAYAEQMYDVRDTSQGYDSSEHNYSSAASSGGAGFSWDMQFLGERHYFNLHLAPNIDGDFRFSHNEGYHDTIQFSDTNTDIYQDASMDLSVSMGWYLGESPFLLGFDEWMSLSEGYNLYSDEVRLRGGGEAFLEAGVGKIRNVAPVIKAWQFLEEKNSADKDKISVLAGLFAKEWRYELRHWRYQKFFYRDIEKLLNDKGVSISAYDLMRLQEIDYSLNQTRLSGYRLKLGLGGYAGGTSVYPETRLTFDFGYPFSRRWQLSCSGNAQVGLDSVENLLYSVEAMSFLEYFVGEVWSIGSVIGGIYENSYEMSALNGYAYTLSVVPLGINIYLDDHLRAHISSSYNLQRFVYPDGLRRDQVFVISAGLTWRLR